MLVRAENPDDPGAISALISDAFRQDANQAAQVPEAWLVETLRGSGAWIPQLSLVAVDSDEIVGYCLCTRAHVGEVPVLALGPIAARVDLQGRGIGTALLNTTIDTAVDLGEPLIALVGDYRYYERFGFKPAATLEIESPEESWGRYFQVLTLPAYETSIRGRLSTPSRFAACPDQFNTTMATLRTPAKTIHRRYGTNR